MNLRLTALFLTIASMSVGTASGETFSANWYSAELVDESLRDNVRNPRTTANRFAAIPEPITVDARLENGALTGVTSITMPDGMIIDFADGTANLDDFIYLSMLVRKDTQLPALNLMLSQYPIAGMPLTIEQVIAATDLLDDDDGPDDIRWAQTDDGNWIADIGVSANARLLATFEGENPTAFSIVRGYASEAHRYLAEGEFARCAQQALLDAGLDPKGVDGAPGPGARSALAAWAEQQNIIAPEFTLDRAAQTCLLLTAPAPRFDGNELTVTWTLWPMWTGDVYNSENAIEMTGVVGEPIDGKLNILQLTNANFGSGVRYGDVDNRDMPLPWSPQGSVLLHGRDSVDGIDGSALAPSVYANELLRLIDGMTDETGRRSLEQMLQVRGLWYDGIRRALGATDVEGTPPQPDWQVLWSVVDRTSSTEIVAADLKMATSIPDNRILFFLEYDPSQRGSRLLYASIATMKPSSSGFPVLSSEDLSAGLVEVDCDAATAPVRSQAIDEHDGFTGFPTRFCHSDTPTVAVVMWMKTNEAGSQLISAATLPDGSALPVVGSYFDEASQSNVFEVGGLAFDGVELKCTVIKPSGGIAVYAETFCE